MQFTKRSFFSVLMMVLAFCCVAGFAASPEASADPTWPSGWDWDSSVSEQAPVGAHTYSATDLNGAPLGEVTFMAPQSRAYINYVFTGGGNGVAAWSNSAKAYVGNDGSRFEFKQVNGEWRWRGYAYCRGHYDMGKELLDGPGE